MKEKHGPIFLDEDHKLLTKALESDNRFASLSSSEKNRIKNRLNAAQAVTAEDFPNDVSRLYDRITLRNIQSRQNLEFKIVPPSESNDWLGRISAISPLGVQLMGVKEGQSVEWQTDKKKKMFVVMEVRNAMYI